MKTETGYSVVKWNSGSTGPETRTVLAGGGGQEEYVGATYRAKVLLAGPARDEGVRRLLAQIGDDHFSIRPAHVRRNRTVVEVSGTFNSGWSNRERDSALASNRAGAINAAVRSIY